MCQMGLKVKKSSLSEVIPEQWLSALHDFKTDMQRGDNFFCSSCQTALMVNIVKNRNHLINQFH